MSLIRDFKCPLSEVKSIEEWMKNGKTKEDCPPCLIAPLSSYYLGTLKEAGEDKLAEELQAVFEQGDILTIAKKLDTIKGVVGEALSKQLIDLDCFAQSYKQDDSD